MKKLSILTMLIGAFAFMLLTSESGCDGRPVNTSALDEQAHTETNQQALNHLQPAPTITYSLERENLIKRFKLMNDRSVMFFIYIFIEGQSQPIGYYQINKVSSVNSQLTNTMQIVWSDTKGSAVLPSPAEDGSYGSNGDAIFGFTPEDIYIESNMHYIVSTVPLHFQTPVNKLTIIGISDQTQLKAMMDRIEAK